MKEKDNKEMSPYGLMRVLAHASKSVLIFAVIIGIISGASSAGLISIINHAIHHPDAGDDLGKIFLILLSIVFVGGMGTEILLVRLAQRSMFKTRLLISRRILASPFRHLEEIGTHRLFATLTEDVQAITDALLVLPNILINMAVLVGCFAYLAWLSPKIFLIGSFFSFIGIATYQGLMGKAMHSLQQARDTEDSLFDHFRGLTSGIKELKLNNNRRRLFLAEDFEPTAKTLEDNTVRGMTMFAVASHWGQLLFFVVVGMLVFFLRQNPTQDNAVLSGAILAISYLMGPLTGILNMIPLIGKAAIAVKKIDSLDLRHASEDSDVEQRPSKATSVSWKEIQLAQTSYSYFDHQGNTFTLGPLDLTLRPAESVFLVGGNGSGKSTLLKLLTGLYVQASGEIFLDGKKIINEVERENYRQLFAVVFSDFHLFERLPSGVNTISSEIDVMAAKYLAQLQLSEKLSVTDGRFSTTSLSQGQRKRLALISAYLEDRPIYIFDEWAADQDPLFREIFYTEIIPELKRRGKMILIATHDDRYFHLADRIVKLDDGKLTVLKRTDLIHS